MKKKINLKSVLSKNRFRVTIFGSARIKPGDKEYKEVYELAKELGRMGIDIVTGGGPGLMRAASKGHKEGSRKKAYTIGLGIKLPHEQRINKYVDVKTEFTRFSERLDNFMLFSNAIIVAHGGIGTMLELMFSWQLIQVKCVEASIPIILLGEQWRGLLRWLKKEPLRRKFFNQEDYDLLYYAKDYKQALKMLRRAYRKFKSKK